MRPRSLAALVVGSAVVLVAGTVAAEEPAGVDPTEAVRPVPSVVAGLVSDSARERRVARQDLLTLAEADPDAALAAILAVDSRPADARALAEQILGTLAELPPEAAHPFEVRVRAALARSVADSAATDAEVLLRGLLAAREGTRHTLAVERLRQVGVRYGQRGSSGGAIYLDGEKWTGLRPHLDYLDDVRGLVSLAVGGVDLPPGLLGRVLARNPAIETMSLGRTAFDPAEFAHLADVAGLKLIDLRGLPPSRPAAPPGLPPPDGTPPVGDAAGPAAVRLDPSIVAALARCPELESVQLTDLATGDPAATGAALGRIKGLKSLTINGGDFDDAGLAALTPGPKLESLALSRLDVSGRGLLAWPAPPALRRASFRECPLEDAALAHLAACPALESLTITGGRITADGVAKLAAVPQLEFLRLDACRLDDAVFAALEGVRVERLYLKENTFTDAAATAFKKAHPGVRLDYDRVAP